MTTNVDLSAARDDDRRTFGPTPTNREILEMLVKQRMFKTSIGAFQAAAMVALAQGLNPNHAPISTGTMWNRGSVNSQVLDFLSWYMPTTTPVRALAQLGNLGTVYISEKVSAGGYSFSEIFEIPRIDLS